MALELIPIGTVLSLLTKQVIKTAQAAKDVLIEKESFKILSKYLLDIEPVLKELQRRELNDSQAARTALEFLEKDVKKANELVDKYKNRARFYLLLRCRHIVKEVQDVTRDVGRALASLSLAGTEVLTDISEKVNILQNEMQRVEFEASHSRLRIVQKLELGLKEQKHDQGFANDMLEEIARAVGVTVEPLQISRELASFRQEKEEAAARKNREEEYFLEQVMELLSRADAARDDEEIERQYLLRVKHIENTSQDYMLPYKSFICPILRRDVMVDPVSLCSGTTCERSAIQGWFESGARTDPVTQDPLDDLSLRSNHQLRKSIEEWKELNWCLKIRFAKKKLESGMDSDVEDALGHIQEIVRENPITKDWIAIEGLININILILGSSHNKDIKRRILITLLAVVEGHVRNKERVIESEGIEQIVPCLGRSLDVSNAALELLFELLHDGSEWKLSASKKLSQQSSAILFLVMLLKSESAEKAETILLKLCDDDDDNIIQAAKASWYKPLINRLIQGPESSRILMVKSLLKMELVEQNLRCLGEEGIIPPLLDMVSGNLECQSSGLSALVELSSCRVNKALIAASGGVPIIIEKIFSCQVRSFIIAHCCDILERLSANNDGIEFLVNSNGVCLDLDRVVASLLALQKNTNSSYITRTFPKPALQALFNICKSKAELVERAVVNAEGVSVILPLLDNTNQGIQELALNLLFLFSPHEPQEIVDFLLVQRRLDVVVGFLEDESRSDAQMAAAGLLANLPKSERNLTRKLIESNGLEAILKILLSGSMDAQENALSVLFRFTDPTNLEYQQKVVELGVYPMLVTFLRSGTVTAKARAAALIGDLSLSTPKLTVMPKPMTCWHFRTAGESICEAHGGICSVSTTFCLLKANALPEVVRLLDEKVHQTAYEALQALQTLVCDDKYHRGSFVLHKFKAISPVLEVLNWGTPSLKEEALGILEKVFVNKELVGCYEPGARLHLVNLTTHHIHEDGHPRSKAARVLALLERYSRNSLPRV